ncbi:MAG: DUF4833 domain-containing protein [Polyangiaceae bacterium]
MSLARAISVLVALVALDSHALAARADQPQADGTIVAAFSIAKSENKNQVQYVVRVDDHCAPMGPTPVSAYWRMLESGPTRTAPLLPREVAAYGLTSQAVVANDASGGAVRIVLKALPSRPLTIFSSRGGDGQCRALVTASIAGTSAHLSDVYVHLKWDGVDYLLLRGWSMDGSHVVRETVAK